MEAWLDQEERSESELLSLAKFGKRYPDRPIEEVSAESLESALNFCETAGTYTRYRTMVTAILNVAKTKGWIAKVPVMAQRKDKKKKPRKWITKEQWAKLYAELPSHMKGMAEFAIETGLRQSNVLGLTWDRVDLKRGFVWIEAEDMKDDDALPVPLSKRAKLTDHFRADGCIICTPSGIAVSWCDTEEAAKEKAAWWNELRAAVTADRIKGE